MAQTLVKTSNIDKEQVCKALDYLLSEPELFELNRRVFELGQYPSIHEQFADFLEDNSNRILLVSYTYGSPLIFEQLRILVESEAHSELKPLYDKLNRLSVRADDIAYKLISGTSSNEIAANLKKLEILEKRIDNISRRITRVLKPMDQFRGIIRAASRLEFADTIDFKSFDKIYNHRSSMGVLAIVTIFESHLQELTFTKYYPLSLNAAHFKDFKHKIAVGSVPLTREQRCEIAASDSTLAEYVLESELQTRYLQLSQTEGNLNIFESKEERQLRLFSHEQFNPIPLRIVETPTTRK